MTTKGKFGGKKKEPEIFMEEPPLQLDEQHKNKVLDIIQ